MNDEIKEKLLKEIKKYPKKQNYESGLSGYCLKVIDSTDKLNRFEKKSFSEILSRWVLEERLDQHEETSKEKNKEFNQILDELLSIIGNISVSDSLEKLDFVYLKKTEIEKAREKLKEIKQKLKGE